MGTLLFSEAFVSLTGEHSQETEETHPVGIVCWQPAEQPDRPEAQRWAPSNKPFVWRGNLPGRQHAKQNENNLQTDWWQCLGAKRLMDIGFVFVFVHESCRPSTTALDGTTCWHTPRVTRKPPARNAAPRSKHDAHVLEFLGLHLGPYLPSWGTLFVIGPEIWILIETRRGKQYSSLVHKSP